MVQKCSGLGVGPQVRLQVVVVGRNGRWRWLVGRLQVWAGEVPIKGGGL